MSMTDPIADLLTRIRNAQNASHSHVEIPASRIKADILSILKSEGYIGDFEKDETGPQGSLRVALKYGTQDEHTIHSIERVSRPGRRIYCGKDEIPRVLNGLGITILSTSRGVMTGADCRKHGVGGEILCNIW